MLKKHLESGSDYTRAMNAAPGTTGEIYNLSTLVYIKKKALNTNLSEYMTWYVLNNKEHFKVNDVYLPSHLVRNYHRPKNDDWGSIYYTKNLAKKD